MLDMCSEENEEVTVGTSVTLCNNKDGLLLSIINETYH